MTVPEYQTHVFSAELELDMTRTEIVVTQALYRDYFCANYSRLAPTAWSSLLDVEPFLDKWWGPDLGFSDAWNGLVHVTESWARKYGVNAPWVRDVAALTLAARWILRVEEHLEELASLDTLDWTIRVTVTDDPEQLPLSFTSGEYILDKLNMTMRFPPLTWYPLKQRKSDFRAQALAEFTDRLDAALAGSMMPKGPIEVDREAVDIFLRTRPGGVSIRSLEKDGKNRSTAQAAIKRAEHRLQIPRPAINGDSLPANE